MDKQQVLEEVKNLASSNQLSRRELLEAYESGLPHDTDIVTGRHMTIADVLYYIGGAIVFAGICILVGQNWDSLNSVTKILVTLGSSVAAYVVAVLFLRNKNTEPIGQAFFFISALLMPLGIIIAFNEAGVEAYGYGYQAIAAAISLFVWLVSYRVFKKNLLHIFNVIFGTWLFFAVTTVISGANPFLDSMDFFFYRGLAVGLSYLFLGYYFDQTDRESLVGPLYAFGVLGFLGSAIVLQRSFPDANYFWEIVYPGLVFGIIFLSTKLKSRTFLVFGAIFLMAYIVKLTSEYFSNNIGWPASLVVAGLALMAVGYYTVQIKKRYLDKPAV